MEFKPGEIVFIVGGNGSGKSTLIKLILGLYTPNRGNILFNGIPVTDKTTIVNGIDNSFQRCFMTFIYK